MSARYVASRAVSTLLMLVGIVVITFLLTHVIPADPARVAAGLRATPQQVAAVRQQLGFDDPVYVQFGHFLSQMAQGDFGRSFLTLRPVTSDIGRYFPATVELVFCAMVLIVVFGIAAGTYVALARNPVTRIGVKVLTILTMGAPVFLTALLAQIVFFGHLGWLPGQGRISGAPPTSITGLYLVDSLVTLNFRALGSAATHLLLPAGVLALSRVGVVMRFVEDQLTEVMRADYVRTARAKGLSDRGVVWRHAMRNALIPVVTMIGLQFGWLLGGSVLVESVYDWPGLGNYMVTSISALDYQPVIGTAVVLGAAFAIINFVVDIVQQLLDPRIARD